MGGVPTLARDAVRHKSGALETLARAMHGAMAQRNDPQGESGGENREILRLRARVKDG
mgnify:CR=1 FL=1